MVIHLLAPWEKAPPSLNSAADFPTDSPYMALAAIFCPSAPISQC